MHTPSVGGALARLVPLLLPMMAAPAAVAQGSYQAAVRFANYADVERYEWSLATVPFAQGAWRPGNAFKPEGLEGELVPFGAPWPDGSIRYAQMAVRMPLGPGRERVVRIVPGAPTQPSFTMSRWVVRGMQNFDWKLLVGTAGGVREVGLTPRRLVHDSGCRKTVYCMDRIPGTDLVYDLWLTFFHLQDNVSFEMRLTSSSTASRAWKQEVDFVALAVRDAVPFFRGATSRGIRGIGRIGDVTLVGLMPRTHLWDGQAQEWWGEMLFYHPEIEVPDRVRRVNSLLAAMQHTYYGCATTWKESGALGPFGAIPRHPPWVTDPRRTSAAERAKFESWYQAPGGVWSDYPMGLFPNANTSGEQDDFGVVKMLHVFHTGLPLGIEQARHGPGEDAFRPEHHREADGTPVRAAAHPDWVAWGGRCHFNTTVCPDRLGKPAPEPWAESHGWWSRGNQHWSSLTLAAGHLLTGSHSLRMEIDNQIELFIAGHTLPSRKPGWSTNGIDSARAVGRTYLSMSWLYLLTGRNDLRQHMERRIVECIVPQWAGRSVSGPVRPIGLAPADARVIPHGPFWRPWEEALAVLGLEAAYRVTGRQEARDVAKRAVKTLLVWGWLFEPNGSIIGSGILWKNNGEPLTAAEYADPTRAVWGYGAGFNLWALPTVKLALGWAIDAGDWEVRIRAERALIDIANARQTPFNRRWDHYYEWDALDR